jgi:hypothetical protein
MGALAINETVAAGLVTAWDLCDQILSAVTIKFRPTNTYNPTTGANVVTWGASVTGKKVLKWEEKTGKDSTRDRDTQGSQTRLTTTKILLRTVDIGAEVPAPDMVILIGSDELKIAAIHPQVSPTFYILEVRK